MEKQIRKIPEFETLEDMAEFWDCHDVTDFEDELEEAAHPVFKNMSRKLVSLRLNPEQHNKLKQIADKKKTDTALLINEWVIHHIEEESIHLLS